MSAEEWKEAPLGSRLLRIETGRSPSLTDTPAAPGHWGVLKVSAINSSGFRPSENKAVDDVELINEHFEVRPGDLLFSRANTPELVGAVCIATPSQERLMLSDKTLRLVVDRRVAVPEFVRISLRHPSVRAQIAHAASGSSLSMQNISQSAVAALKIAWPELDEQRRIVEALDSINVRIAAERAFMSKRSRVQTGALAATLEAHVQDYPARSLAEVSKGPGEYGSSAAAVERADGLPRYVRITDIDGQGNLSADSGSMAGIPWSAGRKFLLNEGDLLIARTGFTAGKSYLYKSTDGVCSFAGFLVRFRINPNVMLPGYAFEWTRGQHFKRWVSRTVREVGQRNISAREYDTHQIPVPPLCEQERVVRVSRAFAEEWSLCEQTISRLQMVRDAVLRDLVSGCVRALS